MKAARRRSACLEGSGFSPQDLLHRIRHEVSLARLHRYQEVHQGVDVHGRHPLLTYPFAKKSSIDRKDLVTEKVFLPRAGHCFRGQVLDACPEVSRSDGDGLQGNSLEAIRQMVASGLAITVLPCSAVAARHAHPRLVAIRFAGPVPERAIGLAWRKAFTRPGAVRVIRESVPTLRILGLNMLR